MSIQEIAKPPLPPFSVSDAITKVRMAENAWNTKQPQKVALAYTADSVWRNRSQFIEGRSQIVEFLTRKWATEHEYRLVKELWATSGNRIAVRFAYEWHDDADQWFRSYGNENWEFAEDGLMKRRIASINDIAISSEQRLLDWPTGLRPEDHPGLTDLGL